MNAHPSKPIAGSVCRADVENRVADLAAVNDGSGTESEHRCRKREERCLGAEFERVWSRRAGEHPFVKASPVPGENVASGLVAVDANGVEKLLGKHPVVCVGVSADAWIDHGFPRVRA